jgi:hypothetical protein
VWAWKDSLGASLSERAAEKRKAVSVSFSFASFICYILNIQDYSSHMMWI